MSPLMLNYYDYEDEDQLVCPRCGWDGPVGGGNTELFEDLLQVSCPRCEKHLLLASFPTEEETEQMANRGNRKALRDLPSLRRRQGFRKRFEEASLRSPDQLPELEGEPLDFAWDQEPGDPDDSTVVRLGDRTVWREPVLWEGWERFNEVKAMMKERYGTRFRSLTPTPRSEMYLYGDDLSAPDKVSPH